jgi:hypothetical protein
MYAAWGHKADAYVLLLQNNALQDIRGTDHQYRDKTAAEIWKQKDGNPPPGEYTHTKAETA